MRIDFSPSERTTLGPEWEPEIVEMCDQLNLRSACAKRHLTIGQ